VADHRQDYKKSWPTRTPAYHSLSLYNLRQSYSVGQIEGGSVVSPAGQISTSTEATRNRLGGQNPSLQRRTSRNSGLGLDSGGLGQVREVEDDEEQGVRVTNSNMYLATQAHQMALSFDQ